MQLFCLRASSLLLDEFIKDNYISIDVPWLLEDVESLQWEQLSLNHEQADGCEELRLFVYEMQDEDLVIVTDDERVYLGDMGDYFFAEHSLDDQTQQAELPPRLHRRGVTWLKPLALDALANILQLLHVQLGQDPLIRLASSVTMEDVDHMLRSSDENIVDAAHQAVLIDTETIREAVEVLKQALRCEDNDRRERAAIALLHYAKK